MDDGATGLNCRLSKPPLLNQVVEMIRATIILKRFQLEWNRSGLIWMAVVSIAAGRTMTAETHKEMEPTAIYAKASDGLSITLSFQKPNQTEQTTAPNANTPLFYAIQSPNWPNGFIPIYQTRDKQTKEWRLSRRLTHGKENFTDPLFFALPTSLKMPEGMLSGRWACEAKHRDGTIDFLHWEIARDGDIIFGRFDQDTDYRFAWLTEGAIRGNKLRFKADYIDATYELEGSFIPHIIRMEGTWRHTEDADGGTWKAEPAYEIELAHWHWKRVNLYQNISPSTGKQSLSVDSPISNESQLLCQVWLPKKEP